MSTAQSLIASADKIDCRLGPVEGRFADRLAVELRNGASTIEALHGHLLSARRYVHAYTEDEGNHPQARDNANALIHQIDTAIAGLK